MTLETRTGGVRRQRQRRPAERGGMLLELVISMAVASILLAAGSALMIFMFKKNSEQLKVAHMYSDLMPAFDQITRRVAMAGAWAGAYDGEPYNYSGTGQPSNPGGGPPANPGSGAPGQQKKNPFTRANWDLQVSPTGDCLLFSYDRNRDGLATLNERMGYRLSKGVLQEGTSVTSCNFGDWGPITDRNITRITRLNFIITGAAVDSTFTRRAVHIELRGRPLSSKAAPIVLKRVVRVRNDLAN